MSAIKYAACELILGNYWSVLICICIGVSFYGGSWGIRRKSVYNINITSFPIFTFLSVACREVWYPDIKLYVVEPPMTGGIIQLQKAEEFIGWKIRTNKYESTRSINAWDNNHDFSELQKVKNAEEFNVWNVVINPLIMIAWTPSKCCIIVNASFRNCKKYLWIMNTFEIQRSCVTWNKRKMLGNFDE